jgi:hypothetical protein
MNKDGSLKIPAHSEKVDFYGGAGDIHGSLIALRPLVRPEKTG